LARSPAHLSLCKLRPARFTKIRSTILIGCPGKELRLQDCKMMGYKGFVSTEL
jgi:hypothetical protein